MSMTGASRARPGDRPCIREREREALSGELRELKVVGRREL